jgi:hypothetical protein
MKQRRFTLCDEVVSRDQSVRAPSEHGWSVTSQRACLDANHVGWDQLAQRAPAHQQTEREESAMD